MLNFKNYFLMNEGGAGGHMLHPLNLPEVVTGKDLVDVFTKSVKFLQAKGAPLKIDGINVSVRLVDTEKGKQFAIYRGAKMDMEGPPATLDYLLTRFAENPNFAKTCQQVLNIFNASIPSTVKELKQLGLYDNPLVIFNTEYVSGSTNVIGYKEKFLAIHYPAQITSKINTKGNMTYGTNFIPFETEVLNAYVEKVNAIAEKEGFKVIHQVKTTMVGKPDLNAALNSELTVAGEIKTLKQWLSTATNPSNKSIAGVNGKPISGINQSLYLSVVQQNVDINRLVLPKSMPTAVDCIVFWHANRLLGKAILDVMESSLGKASEQEGVVINNPAISASQFKITGDFFVRNSIASPFRKEVKGNVKTAVITYGRFNPPTIGHQSLFNTLLQTGMQNKAQLIAVFPTHTVNKDNPLPFELKSAVLQEILPSSIKVLPDGKTLFTVLSYLSKEGYNRVIHIAGSDRLPEYERLIHKYVTIPYQSGDVAYNIADYTFVSSGDRDPDSEGVSGMSATKVRAAAKADDFKTFSVGIAQGLSEPLKQQVYNTIKAS